MKRKEYISPVSFSKNFEALRYLIFTLMLQFFSAGKKDIVFFCYVGIAGKFFFLGKYAAADFIPGIKAAGFFFWLLYPYFFMNVGRLSGSCSRKEDPIFYFLQV